MRRQVYCSVSSQLSFSVVLSVWLNPRVQVGIDLYQAQYDEYDMHTEEVEVASRESKDRVVADCYCHHMRKTEYSRTLHHIFGY